MADVDQLKHDRLRLSREIADALQELNTIYCTYVKPHLTDARMVSGAAKGKGMSATKVVSKELAELLNRNTPTGAFEYGRYQMSVWDAVIRSKRNALKAVEDKLEKARTDAARDQIPASALAGGVQPSGVRQPGPDASAEQDGLQSDLGEWLEGFRRLVHEARDGVGGAA